MYFKDIIGQEELKRRLTEAARKQLVPHAHLFCGQSGVGAFALAMAYARYLNCRQRSETDACGHCPSCAKFDLFAHPDLHFIFPIVQNKEKKREISDDLLPQWRAMLKGHTYFSYDQWLDALDAGNSQPLIYTADSEAIIRKLSLRIYEAEYRIVFVWLPEKMQERCANKLLKLIEEPSPKTIILLVSEEPDNILGTILSRAQRINVRPIDTEDVVKALRANQHLEAEAAREVARLADGDYLKALQVISVSEENAAFLEYFKEMMRNAWARNVRGMKAMSDQLAGIGRERQKNYLAYCQHLIRENFVSRFQAPEINYMNRPEAEFASRFAPYVNERNVFDLLDCLAKAEMHIGRNVSAKMVFFDLALRVTAFIKK